MSKPINTLTKGQKLLSFVKRNLYFIILGVLLVALATTLIVVSLTGKDSSVVDPNPNPNPPVTGNEIVATMPMLNPIVIKGYSDTELQYNETFNQWEAHKAVDLKCTENNFVYSILDGKVESITSSLSEGTTITISHDDGYKSVYSSLSKDVNVAIGDSVKKGDHIGNASASASSESLDGAHLHFVLLKNDLKINPSALLDF